ncbi:hypothetical protein [Salinicola tamaricis]|uniref:hypothetical protein n=1 Tax=Salinicola tamaricis TaxID=1771309 RepID=UPI001A932328|nr:hypothetical protein [Salinicola tamaricis]
MHLYTTDYMEQLLLPRLLPLIRREAPRLQLVTHNTRGRLPRAELESGECDIAIAGFYADLPASYYQQRVHAEGFVYWRRPTIRASGRRWISRVIWHVSTWSRR